MGNAGNILLDDWTGIQLGCNIVAGGTDNLHAALVSLMIGLGTDKGRQERVVDVNDMMRILGYHLVADNLHVAGQHDKRDILFLQQLHLGLLYLLLVAVVFLNAPHVVRYAKLLGYVAQILVVGYDTRNVAVKLASLPTCQQVVQAVTHLTNEDSHTWTLIAEVQAEFHLVTLRIKGGDVLVNLVARNHKSFQFPLNTHKKHAVHLINILIQVNDISLIIGDKLSYFRNNALLIGAVE